MNAYLASVIEKVKKKNANTGFLCYNTSCSFFTGGWEQMTKKKIGAVDVGGGTRGIFGAGVLDYCMDNDLHFDHFVGVSAGSANGASYLAGQRGMEGPVSAAVPHCGQAA